MNEISVKIEALLFLHVRPMSFKKMAKLLEVSVQDVKKGLEDLAEYRNIEQSGIHLIVGEDAAELATNPNLSDVLEGSTKEEKESDLTRPQLETLTIIAYRGPITRPEIEQIRGVNCSIILRNLSIRGFIIEKEDSVKMQATYTVSTELLRALGVSHVKDLPDYDALHGQEKINKLLEAIA